MIFTQAQIDFILNEARKATPEECCGLLVGNNQIVEKILPSPNVAEGDRTRRFEIDPQVRFNQIRESGERMLLGFYHSHPTSVPYPSETDKAMVYEPGLIWVIATLKEIKAFRFNQEKQDFEELSISLKTE